MTNVGNISSEDQNEIVELYPERSHLGMRLDRYVANEVPDLSRTEIQQMIADGIVLVDGFVRRPSFKMTPGQVVTMELPEASSELEIVPEAIPLDILHEDADVLLINKAAGMVVHPAPGHATGTLVNALLHHAPELARFGSARPGIIHRLDKDTSGVMVIAKSERALETLAEQWQDRSVQKHYVALVAGVVEEDSATIDAPIGRNTVNRQQMATSRTGREAITHFSVLERFPDCTLLDVRIETGRTHQIRVHLNFIGYPVIGDPLYGNKVSARIATRLGLDRQFLHATSLGFHSPESDQQVRYEAPLPGELQEALGLLRSEGGTDESGHS